MAANKPYQTTVWQHRAVFSDLPDDALGVIANFTSNVELSLASNRLWGVYDTRRQTDRHTWYHQNRRYDITEANLASLLVAVRDPMVSWETATFQIPRYTLRMQAHMPALYDQTFIRELTITSGEDVIDRVTMEQTLAGLHRAEHLQTLRLDFAFVRPQVGLRTSFAALRTAPALEVLHLGLRKSDAHMDAVDYLALAADLSGGRIRVLSLDFSFVGMAIEEVGALTTLADSPTLESLDVELEGTGLDDRSLAALARLGRSSLRTMRLGLSNNRGIGAGDAGTHLAAFGDAPRLHTLCLDLDRCGLGCSDVRGLVRIRDAPFLETLHLDFNLNQIGDTGAMYLMQLSGARRLTTLTLDLTCTDLGDDGVNCLVYLAANTPSLRSLCLRLGENGGIGDRGVCALAALADVHTLRTLTIDLGSNFQIGQSALGHLGSLMYNPWLTTLRLVLRNTAINDEGIAGLIRSRSTRLETFRLDLMDNNLTHVGVRMLAHQLLAMQSLSDLHLNLGHMGLDGEGAEWIAQLRHTPNLKVLHLDLCGNPIGDHGAYALAFLASAPALQSLTLMLGRTQIGDAGARGLVGLKASRMIHTLHLNLSSNQLSARGVAALADLYEDRDLREAPMRSLFLDLDQCGLSRGECKRALEGLQHKPLFNFELVCESTEPI
jgi:Ran GTPase-activating protein (RanGAP) involved in mRNA processing and transport